MLSLVALIFAKISFSFITIYWKKLRENGVSTISNLSIFVFSVPVLLVLGLLAIHKYGIVLNFKYALLVILWIVPVFLSNIFDVFLLKYQALTEQSSYKLAIETIVAILIDIFLLKMNYDLWLIVAVTLFFIGGSIISKNKIDSINKLPFVVIFLLMSLAASLDVICYAIYKKGLILQPTIFSHIFVTQSILYFLFFIVGAKKFIPDLKSRRISFKDILVINFLIIVYVILEAIVVKELPIVVIVSASILPLVFYATFDFKNKHVSLSYKSILALFLVVLGIIILSIN